MAALGVWEASLPSELWKRLLSLLSDKTDDSPFSELLYISRLSFVDRSWRARVWYLVENLIIKYIGIRKTGSLPKACPTLSTLLPSPVSFANLRSLTVIVPIDVDLVFQASPRLQSATISAVCDRPALPPLPPSLATHPSLTDLNIVFERVQPEFHISPCLPRQLRALAVQVLGLERLSFVNIASDVPSLTSLSYFTHSPLPPSHLPPFKDLTSLRKLSLPRLDYLSVDIGIPPDSLDACAGWVRTHLPPMPLNDMVLGNFSNTFLFSANSSVLLAEKALALGFRPTLGCLHSCLHYDRVEVGLHILPLLDPNEIPFPPEAGSIFISALRASPKLTSAVFARFLPPYVKHNAPLLHSKYPGSTLAEIEAYIGSLCLVDQHKWPRGQETKLGALLDNHQLPFNLNFKFFGEPFFHSLPPAILRSLIARADALKIPIDWRAQNDRGETILAVAKTNHRYKPRIGWQVLEMVAKADLAWFLERPLDFIGRDEDDQPNPSRIEMYRLLVANWSKTLLTRKDIVLYLSGEGLDQLFLLDPVCQLLVDDAERLECVQTLLFRRSPPDEGLSQRILVDLTTSGHSLRSSDGSTPLHLCWCLLPSWDRILGADAIRTFNSAGITPLHHWADHASPSAFWNICLRHNARIEDFALADSSGRTVLSQCEAIADVQVSALKSLLENPTAPAQLLSHFLKVLSTQRSS